MEHLSEDDLLAAAFEMSAIPEQRRGAVKEHLSACSKCRRTVDFLSVAEDDLRDPEVWEAVIGSPAADALADFVARIEEEDRQAETLLRPLLASAGTTAWTDITKSRRFRTGGVARRLTAHAHTVCEQRPLDALTFAEASITIAELLPDDSYPGNAVYEIRGTAWKESANAQLLLGRLPQAHESLNRAERAYKHLLSASLGLASVALVRASVYYCQQNLAAAAQMAELAEHAFAHLGDDERRATALSLRASIKYEARDLEGASSMFRQVIEYAEASNDAASMARGLYALASCEILRGDLNDASMHLHHALTLLREGGPARDRISAEWALARVLLQSGKFVDAVRRLDRTIADFEALGMLTDAALATLHKAEALLALGEMRSIAPLMSRTFRTFADAGMLTGALSAIAYVKEAAATGALTVGDLEVVYTFLRRVERKPDLLFVPPGTNRNSS